MIFKRRLSTAVLLVLCGVLATTVSGDDFKFDSEDLQIVYSDPPEAVMKPPSRYLYAKEIAQCPTGESKMILTLLLQSLRWSDVSEKKKEKAIKKLSRFFLVPRQFITVDDIHTPEILEMLKHSINKSNNLLNTKETVGRIEFMIGCGEKLFENGKSVAHQINEYVKSGALDELSGLPMGWWNIWSKHVKSRVQRTKRQTDGSGNEADLEEEDDLYPYDDDEGEPSEDEYEDPDSIDEPEAQPTKPPQQHVRHQNKNKANKSKKKVVVTQVQDEPAEPAELDLDIPESPIKNIEILPPPREDPPEIPEEPVVTTTPTTEVPTPIDFIENIKLESLLNKTIVNDNNVVDVPVYEAKDEILEAVEKLFTEPSPEPTTVITTSVETTTFHHVPETTTTVLTTTESPMTTVPEEVVKPSTVGVITSPPEAETIFDPIETGNNENIIVYVEESTTVASTTTESTTTLLEDEITERLPTTLAHEPTTTPPPTTSSTTHFPITETLPTSTTEIITTSSEPSTTTLVIVDATLAVDKASNANTGKEDDENVPEEEKKSHPKKSDEDNETNYDEEYDDELPDGGNSVDVEAPPAPPTTHQRTTPSTPRTTTLRQTLPPSTTPQEEETVPSTRPTILLSSSADPATEPPSLMSTSESPESPDDYDENKPPRVANRVPKAAAMAGKPFSIRINEDVFYDEEDQTNLKLELLDADEQPLPSSSWIQFNKETREIYGLPLESDVSKYDFILRATDNQGEYVNQNIDITVHQHKLSRSLNHEISMNLMLEKSFPSPADWEIRLIRGIVEALGDDSIGAIVVRNVTLHKSEPNLYTFIYSNETLPREYCPKEELEVLMGRMSKAAINKALEREITIKNFAKELSGANCKERVPPKQILTSNNNFPPTVRNPIDRIQAHAGKLLVFTVPKDAFYDPEDENDLKLSLLNHERKPLDPNNWLQFDSKNREFYGVPSAHDKSQSYILVAQDKNGLTANDALVVDVKSDGRRDFGVGFDYQLDIPIEQFSNAAAKRRFIEIIAKLFGDPTTDNILMKIPKKLTYARQTTVVLQNTTLGQNHIECPHSLIQKLKNKLLRPDKSVLDEVKAALANDFPVTKITLIPTAKCSTSDIHPSHEEKLPPADDMEHPIMTQDVLITYVLPTAIILLMLLIALIIACLLYRRRSTGKMELGDEEERKSFRSKGIPVIFQDELDEKPEIVTKSPIILKDEKPPLLPQYNGLSQDGDEDNMDQYIPPQPLLMGSRESRGKSPVTPSYRKPPPYVSP